MKPTGFYFGDVASEYGGCGGDFRREDGGIFEVGDGAYYAQDVVVRAHMLRRVICPLSF